jgi:hypothetical protein
MVKARQSGSQMFDGKGTGPTFRAIVFRAQCDDQGVNLAEKDQKCNARKKAYNGLDGCMQNAVVMTTISASRPQDPGPFHFANRTLRALLPHYDAFVKVRTDWNLLLILLISMVSLVAYIGLRVYHLVTGKTKAMEGDNVKVWYSWVAVCAETLTSLIGFYSGMLVWRQYVRFQAVSVEDSKRLHAVRILLCQSACSMPCLIVNCLLADGCWKRATSYVVQDACESCPCQALPCLLPGGALHPFRATLPAAVFTLDFHYLSICEQLVVLRGRRKACD